MGRDAAEMETDGAAESGDSAANRSIELPIEPGRPDPENVLFTLLGVLIALAVVVRLFQLYG